MKNLLLQHTSIIRVERLNSSVLIMNTFKLDYRFLRYLGLWVEMEMSHKGIHVTRQ